MTPLMRSAALTSLLLAAVSERPALACSVCFGAGDNAGLVKAFYFGGAILLTCTFALIGGLVWAIVRLEKARLARDRAAGLHAEDAA